ncbi:hypothetical protein AVDCRST_MAG84-4741 [uncultured Microcoleus sp.]|uniref:Uncharacterized protein n=1 Tax=uncultured Microcoleus sp. TaxID=259945 RepID=A0A6J4N7A4_9CYAN|nr:hypothetical protein AVDCRST_MAG84-4741 [uncultured Microcoleus sp.]
MVNAPFFLRIVRSFPASNIKYLGKIATILVGVGLTKNV